MEDIKNESPEEAPKNEINEEKEEKKEEKKDDEKKEENEDKKEDEKEEKKKDKKSKKDKKKIPKKEKKKEPKKVDKSNIIYSIDEQNKLCVDCGAENPTKVSINNGVIICDSCSKEHEALGSSISFLKNINDDYDEFLINFIVMGSNTKFKRFLLQEKVDSNLPIKTKYKTAALNYYRKNLKAKVEGKEEIKVDFEDPNQILEDVDDIYPEFNKKYVVKNQVLRKGNLINQNKFSFKFIFNKVFNRNKNKRRKSFDKKRNNDITEIDMNKTMPPELSDDKKDNILESNRPFQEDDKEEKKDKDKENNDVIKPSNNEIKDKEE